MANLLNAIANLTWEERGEGASTHASGVCFDDTNGGLDSLRRDTKASANATDSRVAGSDVWVGTKVHVEHGGVSTLRDNPLRRILQCLVHVVDAINEHAVTGAVELLVELAKLVELSSGVEVLDGLSREVPLEALNKVVILNLERVPVSEVTSTHANS